MQNSIFSTLFIGQNLVKLSEVNSTNTYLKELVSKSEPLIEGTVIMADHQFAGRGQKDNIWYSQAGKNLTFSIYLKPSSLAVSKQFILNMVICLGIVDALKPILGNDSKIKWPNDIYFKNNKLGGILIENGWIRILGSGSAKLNRSLPEWNLGKSYMEFGQTSPFLLVADDAIGGFFILNGGGLGNDFGKI